MTFGEKVEVAAEAMFVNRFGDKHGLWDRYKHTHPDIANIYRDYARVALEALERGEAQ